jgi:hypothetical protein
MSLQRGTTAARTRPSDTMVFLLIRFYAFYSNLNVCERFINNLHCIHKTRGIFHNSTWHLPQ